MGTYELRRLVSYDNQSLIDEIRRVAALVSADIITVAAFERVSRVDVTTLRRRFGSWREALVAAGLGHRVNDENRPKSKEEVVAELQRVASLLGAAKLGRREYEKHSKIKSGAVTSTFGSWRLALEAAALSPTYIREPSDSEFLENLLAVWTYHERAPQYRDMKLSPSKITGKAYVRRWGSWMKALQAFVDEVDREQQSAASVAPQKAVPALVAAPTPDLGPREPPLGLRYRVLKRDRFRCALCGASPATRIGCELHVDHIVPYSRGGPTMFENLRAACQDCNLGKGAKSETDV